MPEYSLFRLKVIQQTDMVVSLLWLTGRAGGAGNTKRWIVDDEAAHPVVKRIYSMTLDGLGTEQIAAQLERDEILVPRAYWLKKGVKRPRKDKQLPPTRWNNSTITKIFSLQEYCGDILNFKTYSKSYKNKKRIDNDRWNCAVFKDVHEPIIDRAVWEQVQQKCGTRRRRRTKIINMCFTHTASHTFYFHRDFFHLCSLFFYFSIFAFIIQIDCNNDQDNDSGNDK